MALVEYLERNTWEETLRRSFTTALHLLRHDRFRLTSSAVDDVRAWLAVGGVSHAKARLYEQMLQRQLFGERIAAVTTVFDRLIVEHGAQIVELLVMGIIPPDGSGEVAVP